MQGRDAIGRRKCGKPARKNYDLKAVLTVGSRVKRTAGVDIGVFMA